MKQKAPAAWRSAGPLGRECEEKGFYARRKGVSFCGHYCAMKTSLTTIWLCLLLCWVANASGADLVWFTDLAAAQGQANVEKKSVLLVFHGSDWCPPCIELQRQVFQSAEFADYARKTLVLVDVDFPEKPKQSVELKRANLALKAKFNVGDNYPTVVLLDAAGETVLQEAGYFGGGPSEVLAELKRHAIPAAVTAGSVGFKASSPWRVGVFLTFA
jgi:thioredoxin-related protein